MPSAGVSPRLRGEAGPGRQEHDKRGGHRGQPRPAADAAHPTASGAARPGDPPRLRPGPPRLRQLGLPRSLAHDALLVSELVTNSVRHAGLGPDQLIRITADWSGTRLRVHVRDRPRGEQPPWVPESIRPPPGAESGWGLYLVDRLARHWGTSADGYWFELRADPPG